MSWNDINEKILKALDLRAEFEAMGVKVVSQTPRASGWLDCHGMGREDKNPSAGINIITGRYKDFGAEGLSLSFWDFATSFGGFPDWSEARKHFAAKAGVDPGRGRRPANASEKLHFEVWSEGNHSLLKRWCETYPGILPAAVKASGCRVALYPKKSKAHKVLAFPVFGAPEWTDGDPISWVVQNISPNQKLPKFGKDKRVEGFVKRKSIAPVRGGLMNFYSLSRIQNENVKWIFSVEGVSDFLTLQSCIPKDYRNEYLVISNAGGASEDCTNDVCNFLAGKRVVLIRDCDAAGTVGYEKWGSALRGSCEEVKIIRLPFEIRDKDGQDLRDLLNMILSGNLPALVTAATK